MRFLSLFSGIDAASVAWNPLGWEAAGFSEIEPFPCAVLAHHYPNVPNLGDVTKADVDAVGPVDVVVGGSPCQSFSIAGKRLGMDDARGNLALVYGQVVYRKRPRWFVFENVPGLLSSDSGWDFGTLLAAFSGQPPGSVYSPPEGGWRNTGVVKQAEGGYGLAWRVLDAQFCRVDGFVRAVPQRRRRVFVVGHLGDWRRAAAVLFERESLQGHSAPSRQPGERPAPTLAARTKGGGGLGTDFDCDGGLIPFDPRQIHHPANHSSPKPGDPSHPLRAAGNCEPAIAYQVATRETAATLTRGAESAGKGGYVGRRQEDDVNLVAYTLNAKGGAGRTDAESETLIPCIRNGGGFDASEDGTGRGTPLVPAVAGTLQMGGRTAGSATNQDAMSDLLVPVGYMPTRTFGSDGFDASEDGTGRGTPLVPAGVALRGRDGGGTAELTGDIMTPLRTGGGGGDKPHVLLQALQSWRVRRLMPVECEKLQGFPPGYTAIPYRGKIAADGPRYKAIGNSMAVNVMRLIGHRIQMVEAM